MPNIHSVNTPLYSKNNGSWKRDDAVINITDLRLRTYIGFNPEELSKQQDVLINCELSYRADEACNSDDEATALNYKIITKQIIRHVEEGRFRLLEKLAEDLLQFLMENEMVIRAKVRNDKPHALRFADSVSVTLSASRP
jgi:D-erythro-7,8-dihydroneopterin triphosphate epimerase